MGVHEFKFNSPYCTCAYILQQVPLLGCKSQSRGMHSNSASMGPSMLESDEIFPVHFIDQAGIIRSSIINYTFRYNDVLDANKLHNSLNQLLHMGEWRKLGGRLRLNVRITCCIFFLRISLTRIEFAEKWATGNPCT
jgi:hypothetical protein